MKESSFTLKELNVGLRPFGDIGRNTPYFLGLKNLKCGAHGLEELPEVVVPFEDDEWPFPQVMVLSQMVLVATSMAVFEVTDLETMATLHLFDQASQEPWEVADFGEFIVMTNGEEVWQRIEGSWERVED